MGLLWLMGEDALALGGTVKDHKGGAVEGALVTLASDASFRQVSGADGGFTIDRPVLIKGMASTRKSGRCLVGLGIQGGSLQVVLPALAPPCRSIILSASQGRKRFDLTTAPLEAGSHLLDLPPLALGVYSMWITLGRLPVAAHLVHTPQGSIVLKRPSGVGRPAIEVDALLVRKPGFKPARFPISSFDQNGIAIVLDPMSPAASAAERRGSATVTRSRSVRRPGASIAAAPGPGKGSACGRPG